ncbi:MULTISPECIES: response regulator [unclassified Sulfitobacter]|uniref:response regulator n=1 Tax=unclassified Sulfitobacter TaxID=196795 RepID=UPI0023E1A9AE|nr:MULTISPECIES: response regulator [unclassified Sulfitobacter]
MKQDMNILLVEDNDVDVEILKRSLKKLGSTGSLLRAKDGVEALEILCDHTSKEELSHPYVILLDINMPRMNGHEFLAKLRQTDKIRLSRVFVFTTSASKRDVALAYENNANGYIVKPDSASELSNVLKTLQEFWQLCKAPDAV